MGAKKFTKESTKPGAPLWMVTFADMMCLFLGFFIVILSMSETKISKFKNASGSMRDAFGVHKTYVEEQAPLNEKIVNAQFAQTPPKEIPASEAATVAATDAQTEELQTTLKAFGQDVEVIPQGKDIVLRLRSDALFTGDQSKISDSFLTTLQTISKETAKLNKFVIVYGHTDNQSLPSNSSRSLWDLSNARATSVALAMMKLGGLSADRFTIVGHADTRPLLDNETKENQAKNRRLEIVLKNEKP